MEEMMKNMSILITFALFLSGCSSSTTPTLTATAPQTAAPSPTATQTPSLTSLPSPIPSPESTAAQAGIPFSAPPITFVIPAGLATGASADAIKAVAPSETFEGIPAHEEFSLKGGSVWIDVFPAHEYAVINKNADDNINLLEKILSAKTPPTQRNDLPFIRTSPAGGRTLGVKAKILQFSGGAGLRAVTEYTSDVRPVNNEGLLYEFAGLSDDRQFYIYARCYINLPFLPPDGNPTSLVPPGGIPFPQDFSATGIQDYMKQVTAQIESSPANQFDPPLDMLDALMQSISSQ